MVSVWRAALPGVLVVLAACSGGTAAKTTPVPSATAGPNQALLCQDALQRRQAALAELAQPRRVNNIDLPYRPGNPLWKEAEQQRDAAEADVQKYCGSSEAPTAAAGSVSTGQAASIAAPPAVQRTPQAPAAAATTTPTPSPQPTAPAAASGTAIADPFAFCAAVGTADWSVTDYQGTARYVGPDQPFPGKVWRCWDGKVLGCETGATAGQCMKPNLSREPGPQLVAWCRANPDSSPPFAATGHATAYYWACTNGAPLIIGDAEFLDPKTGQLQRIADHIDGLGYLIGPWDEIPRP